MTTQYGTNFSGTFPFSDTNFMMTLAVTTALPITVPGTPNQQYRAKFSIVNGATVFVCLNGVAVLPTAGVATPVANQELLGWDSVKYVKGGDTLSFIGPAATSLGVSLLLVQQT